MTSNSDQKNRGKEKENRSWIEKENEPQTLSGLEDSKDCIISVRIQRKDREIDENHTRIAPKFNPRKERKMWRRLPGCRRPPSPRDTRARRAGAQGAGARPLAGGALSPRRTHAPARGPVAVPTASSGAPPLERDKGKVPCGEPHLRRAAPVAAASICTQRERG